MALRIFFDLDRHIHFCPDQAAPLDFTGLEFIATDIKRLDPGRYLFQVNAEVDQRTQNHVAAYS